MARGRARSGCGNGRHHKTRGHSGLVGRDSFAPTGLTEDRYVKSVEVIEVNDVPAQAPDVRPLVVATFSIT